MPAADGWGAQLGQPGVLLMRCLGPRQAEGVALAIFGHTCLGMLIDERALVTPFEPTPTYFSWATFASRLIGRRQVSGEGIVSWPGSLATLHHQQDTDYLLRRCSRAGVTVSNKTGSYHE
jgi:hypothetical protein